jgi:amino acid transporter
VFGYVHPRFRTPAVAIVFTALIALGLALSGNFATLAASSAVSRLIV